VSGSTSAEIDSDRLPDLTGRADIETLLRAFYAQAFADDLLGHVFLDVAQMDLDAHLR
jgi:hemoglobin